jgi:hypothetical protein
MSCASFPEDLLERSLRVQDAGVDPLPDGGPLVDSGGTDAGDANDGSTVWPVNGHRYAILTYATFKTWNAARNDAVATGGHLVTITSFEEEIFVTTLVKSRPDVLNGAYGPWIGAQKPTPGGAWTWITGEPWGYTAWRAGEPNNSDGNEQYAHLYLDEDEGWNDVESSGGEKIRSAVVEYE